MKNTLLRFAAALTPMLAIGFLASPALAYAIFTIGAPTPSAIIVSVPTQFSSTYSASVGGSNVHHCNLSLDGTNQGAMTLTSGTATKTITITTAGTHEVRTTCYDKLETYSAHNQTNVSVSADTAAPSLSPFSFTPALSAGTPTTISTYYSESDFGSGIQSCILTVDGIELLLPGSGLMTLSGGIGSLTGTASKDHTFASSGSHPVVVECSDRAGNTETHTETVTVPIPVDTITPTIGAISPTTATAAASTAISASFSDNIGVTACTLHVNGVLAGDMTRAGTTSGSASMDYIFPSAGSYSTQVNCFDLVGNVGMNTGTVTVTTASTADTISPTVLSINPSSVTTGASTLLSATFADNVGVSSCRLYVNSALVGVMGLSGTTAGTATASYTFPSNGNHSVKVNCSDAAGNTGTYTRTISASSLSSTSPYALQLVKLACPTYGIISVNDPCKAVYYVGTDGKRHAFPNEKAYFTWYTGFDGVLSLDSSTLSSMPLGTNVTYRPGVRMVKFTTLGRVYAVSRYGTLRWVASESAATSLYGSAWNTKIDDISDTFFSDYTFGADINTAADFNVTSEASTVASINVNL